jgi:hypothetical protein
MPLYKTYITQQILNFTFVKNGKMVERKDGWTDTAITVTATQGCEHA